MNDTGQGGLPGSLQNLQQDGRVQPVHGGIAGTQPARPGPGPAGAYVPPAGFKAAALPGPHPQAPYGHGRRLFYGLLWSGWTLLLGLGGLFALPHGRTFLGGLLALGLAVITGRYAYRIWTWQAKRLVFFIIW